MNKKRANRQIALVIDASSADPHGDLMTMMQLARRFSDERIPATWVVDSPEIAAAICPNQRRRLIDWAAPWSRADSHERVGEAAPLKIRLQLLRAAGFDVAAIFTTADIETSRRERQLAALGISTVVASRSRNASRPLPHGLWQLGVDVSLPIRRRWTQIFAKTQSLPSLLRAPLTVVGVNVERLKANPSRGSRQIARLIDYCTWSVSRGNVEVSSIRELAIQRTSAYANRPQRSILRAA